MGILFALLDLINSRRTRYYLTTTPLVEARGGHIWKQMPLEHFHEHQQSDFLESKSTYREGVQTYHEIRITDPTSGKVIRLTGLDDDAKEDVIKAFSTITCPTCGVVNMGNVRRCRSCETEISLDP